MWVEVVGREQGTDVTVWSEKGRLGVDGGEETQRCGRRGGDM